MLLRVSSSQNLWTRPQMLGSPGAAPGDPALTPETTGLHPINHYLGALSPEGLETPQKSLPLGPPGAWGPYLQLLAKRGKPMAHQTRLAQPETRPPPQRAGPNRPSMCKPQGRKRTEIRALSHLPERRSRFPHPLIQLKTLLLLKARNSRLR